MTATLDAMKAAQTYTIDKMHSEVTFQVRQPVASSSATRCGSTCRFRPSRSR